MEERKSGEGRRRRKGREETVAFHLNKVHVKQPGMSNFELLKSGSVVP